MKLRKVAWMATMAGALGAVSLGFGAGLAAADDWRDPIPDIPGIPGVWLGVPPGHLPPPGEFRWP